VEAAAWRDAADQRDFKKLTHIFMNHEMCLSENFRAVKNRNPNPIYLACFQIAPTITTANSQPDNGREKFESI